MISYLVQLRTREIGIRLALGASPARVRTEVLTLGARHTSAGLIAGLLAFAGVWRLMSSALRDVGRVQPLALAGLIATIFGVAIVATWFPAQRATKVDPLAALRCD